MADVVVERRVEIANELAEGTPIWLVVDTKAGACAVAAGRAVPGGVAVGPIGAAKAEWLAPGLTVSATAERPCTGLPEPEVLAVPAGGVAVDLKFPVASVDVVGGFSTTDVGDGWWAIRPTDGADGTVVFRHADQAPTTFLVHPDAAAVRPAGPSFKVAVGGVALIPDVPTWVDVGPEAAAAVVPAGTGAVVLGRATGAADGLWRCAGRDPEPVHVDVAGFVASVDQEWRVPAGGKRVRRSEVEVSAAHVADPHVAEVTVDGRRITVRGLAPGRTQIAFVGGDAVYVVTVAVGS